MGLKQGVDAKGSWINFLIAKLSMMIKTWKLKFNNIWWCGSDFHGSELPKNARNAFVYK